MLFMYIHNFLRDRFSSHKISNVPRSCNSRLRTQDYCEARLNLGYGLINAMAYDPPDIVKNVVARECAELSMSNTRP